jgi:hypothetical protein
LEEEVTPVFGVFEEGFPEEVDFERWQFSW